MSRGARKVSYKGENSYSLIVADNGKGMPKDFDSRDSGSLGMKLVRTLAELQLHGKLVVDGSNGTTVRVDFEDRDKIA